ncbi:nucleotide sugar dehydrogenase [Actinocrispum wychmicini]|uniref:UDP-N-acetyl-D-glucosamine dehydrogenase n=1 Tax=Actinocrispum wychmicini TaxID=1213861 RepID=A0A4R2JIQ5_9PSEU|nr:nucleotide sugar dehydrogenase [Actinocrispum wychmicini]TCO59781.1 UDP-N-acetyl-D-glucosamine dehydrogenase [Actinocrispum wychmicini]
MSAEGGVIESRLVVVGQGYVGLPLAVRAAEVGHSVVGYDVDTGRIGRLASGTSYVEDISDERLAEVLAGGRYVPTTDPGQLAGFDVAVVTVPTPLLDDVPDLSFVESAALALAPHLTRGALVVLESTTYPGTTEDVFGALLEKESGLAPGTDFHLGYSPERIDPGNQYWTFERTPKLVSGVDEESLRRVREFYDTVVESTVPVSSLKTAELAKLIENTYRHVNVALVNEMAVVAHELGVDIWDAIGAASSKPFGFMRFTPGPGVGGHCLPVDPRYLSWRVERQLGRRFRFVDLANDVNNQMPRYVVQRLTEALNQRQRSANGSRVLVLGLAYKRNSGDARESPAVRTAELLIRTGAEVHAADPHVRETMPIDPAVVRVELTKEEIVAADAVVIVTDHDEFDYDMVRAHARYVLDCRNRLALAAHIERL